MLKLVFTVALLLWPVSGMAQTSCLGDPATVARCVFSSGPFAGRDYRLHVPNPLGGGSHPLIVVLHGGGGTEDGSDNDIRRVVNNSFTPPGMEALADAASPQMIVAYPLSECPLANCQWNYGPEPGALCPIFGSPGLVPCLTTCTSSGLCADDPGFVNAVVADIKSHYTIDATKVAFAGHSGGAGLIIRMLCVPGLNVHMKVAWVIEAPYMWGEIPFCTLSDGSIRAIFVHGTQDIAVPYTCCTKPDEPYGPGIGGVPLPSICPFVTSSPSNIPPPFGPFSQTPPCSALLNDFRGGGTLTTPVGYFVWQVFAKVRGADMANPSSFVVTNTGYQLGLGGSPNHCVTTVTHPAANMSLVTIGSGVRTPKDYPALTVGSIQSCSYLSGGGHTWPGSNTGYGIPPATSVFQLSKNIIDSLRGLY